VSHLTSALPVWGVDVCPSFPQGLRVGADRDGWCYPSCAAVEVPDVARLRPPDQIQESPNKEQIFPTTCLR
jgi:hypothetical protein